MPYWKIISVKLLSLPDTCEMLESFVQTRYPSLSVKFIHNELYATTNNIYSLWLALPEVQQEKEIILLDSDILFDPLMIKILRDAPHANCLALDSHKLGEEEIKVIVNGKNQITELSKTCSIEKAIGESIGIEKYLMPISLPYTKNWNT